MMKRILFGAALMLALAPPAFAGQGLVIGRTPLPGPARHGAHAKPAHVIHKMRALSSTPANCNPNFTNGQIPAYTLWNAAIGCAFPSAGGMLGGPLGLPASTTSQAQLTLTPGATPTAPANGQVWYATGVGLMTQQEGSTIGPIGTGGGAGGPITLASGAVASGAYGSGAYAAGSFVVGALADGAVATIGTMADTPWSGTGSGSEVAILKRISNSLASVISAVGTPAASAVTVQTGASTPLLVSCPDGTTNCFAGGGGGGSNASVGTNGATAPSASTQVGFNDGTNHIQAAGPSSPFPVITPSDKSLGPFTATAADSSASCTTTSGVPVQTVCTGATSANSVLGPIAFSSYQSATASLSIPVGTTATVVPELSVDPSSTGNSSRWVPAQPIVMGVSSVTPPLTNSAVGVQINASGAQQLRFRITAISGGGTVTLNPVSLSLTIAGLQSSGGSGSNAAVGAINATAPGSAVQIGAPDASGNLQAVSAANPMHVLGTAIQAASSAPINISTAATTQLVAAVGGKAIYVTAWDVMAAGTGNITLEYGTGANCGTGTNPLTGAYPLVAQVGIAKGNGLGPVLLIPTSNALCALTSAAVQMSGSVSYVQQ